MELKRLLEFRTPDQPNADQVRRAAAEHWFQRGLELEQTGAPLAEVIEAYQKAVELDPTSAGALVNLGTIQFNARNWKDAERYYLEALEADPQYALAHFDLANLYDERGDRVRALEHYQAALEISPSYADAHYNLALLYQGCEPDHESRAALDRIPEAGPLQPLVQHRAAGVVQAPQSGRGAGHRAIEPG